MLEVRKITGIRPNDWEVVDRAFDSVEPQKIACCNWADEYPYTPDVRFRIFHTGDYLMVRFDVAERYTAALVDEDNGRVWTDSCVEIFIAPDEETYYNFETSCIGHMLFGAHRRGEKTVPAPPEVLASVKRHTSLPSTPFEERVGDNRWHVVLAIPPQALFQHGLEDWSGLELRANLYKCGDNLSHPHFLSWRPIRTEKPNFHRPEFFDHVKLAK